MEKNFNLLNFARPLTGMNIERPDRTSAQLMPKAAATQSHKSLSFSPTIGSKLGGIDEASAGYNSRNSFASVLTTESSRLGQRRSRRSSDSPSEESSQANS
jgi:hypothetical protein